MTEETDKVVILERQKRLSETLIWDTAEHYYEEQGISAWINAVPFYITSNPFIAKSYAKVIMHFIRDWINKNPQAKQHPFYILEIGAGSGRFSFYALKAIQELRKEYNLENISIIYVMSDIAKLNLEFHQAHHALQPYIKKGLLDFAFYSLKDKDPIPLLNSKIELGPNTLQNPLLLIANYIFDTITCDAFTIQQGKLHELLFTLATEEDNLKEKKIYDLEKIAFTHHLTEINNHYYRNAPLDAILDLYKNTLTDTSVLIPTGAIHALENLKKLSNNKLMMISSDKAYTELMSLDGLGYPTITFHGTAPNKCISVMVNSHAIGQYCINCGGDYIPQPSRRGIKTCVYTIGFKLDQLQETRQAVKEYIGFSLCDFFNIYRHMIETIQQCELDVLISFMQLSNWDPYAYIRISNRISGIVTESEPDTVSFLEKHMNELAENYYYLPQSECVLFEIGVFYHALKLYQKALYFYAQATDFVGEQFGLHYNTALCLHHLNKSSNALKYFKLALKLDPDSQDAKNWITYLQKTTAEEKFQPKDIYK